MEEKRDRKNFLECFSDFISDPENLTREELLAELQEEGIDTVQLKKGLRKQQKKARQKGGLPGRRRPPVSRRSFKIRSAAASG